ncbi:MAG: branched-chain amino acid ABC transporter permease [Gammaproteobacteria bacterium]|nr:branched-chain amino acid ABC transporter permease [Gammaproteobacteria bacterium]
MFLEVLLGGLLAGVMYSSVALGFVLIYKASGVFNFAQGSMVLFTALMYVTFVEAGIPFWIALLIVMIVMVVCAVLIERMMLRPMANRDPMVLFVATLGLSFMIEGIAQLAMGTDVHILELGVADGTLQIGDLWLSEFDLFATAMAVLMVVVISFVFNTTRIGISLRAVADDVLAAQSIGIKLPQVWRIVWSVAGFVALAAGLLWGARQGVQFSLTLSALKALPVLIIGGFSSMIGAIVAGLLVGATESLADFYLGPIFRGSVSAWFAYILAVFFLLIKPAGLFGEREIERV